MTTDLPNQLSAANNFVLYTAPNGAVKVRVLFRDESVWLTQKGLAELFGVKVPAIAKHLKNIFESGELREISVVSILEITAADGKNYQTQFYNLDAIIAVGYRANSFLELSSYPILQDKGKVSAIEAKLKAEGEYELYRVRQDAEYVSDFDRAVQEALRLEGFAGGDRPSLPPEAKKR